jgi:predicted N-acetyltransferase YhbS
VSVSETAVQIQVHDVLPEPMRSAAHALSRASFAVPERTPEQQDEHRDRFCNMRDAVKWIVAAHGGEVVGLAVAYRRAIRFAGWPMTLGGIGDVCAAPAYRRQGIALRLVRAALDELRWVGCDVAYLCARLDQPGLTALYGQAGFVRLNHGHTYLGASGQRYVDQDGMIAPVLSQKLFEAIMVQPEPFDIGQGNW